MELSQQENTGVGWHALLQGIFLSQGSNLGLLVLLHHQLGFLPLESSGKCLDVNRTPKWLDRVVFQGFSSHFPEYFVVMLGDLTKAVISCGKKNNDTLNISIFLSLSLTHTHTYIHKILKHGIKDFGAMIKLKTKRWGVDSSWMILAGPTQSRESLKAEPSSWLWWAGEVTKEQWPERCHSSGFEDGGRDHRPTNAEGL